MREALVCEHCGAAREPDAWAVVPIDPLMQKKHKALFNEQAKAEQYAVDYPRTWGGVRVRPMGYLDAD